MICTYSTSCKHEHTSNDNFNDCEGSLDKQRPLIRTMLHPTKLARPDSLVQCTDHDIKRILGKQQNLLLDWILCHMFALCSKNFKFVNKCSTHHSPAIILFLPLIGFVADLKNRWILCTIIPDINIQQHTTRLCHYANLYNISLPTTSLTKQLYLI